ncbi:MAG: hypothetical protein NC122_04120 [Faecalibacterium sp.]|nr:hypothetical protein [Ruminococcus sp.]MCM1391715.1 hypothetical protein [Ruminococcus sp.]MCM1485372.1 hypothetical protein [Faecalibacterium sp.]
MAFGYYGNYQPPFYSAPMPDNLAQLRANQQPMQQMQTIQPQQSQPIQPTLPTPQTSSNGIIWVQGEEGAKAYLVAPNSTVVLWDSENPTIYLKSADGSGIPSMRTLDWVERNTMPKVTLPSVSEQNTDKFVTREEFDALKAQLEAMKAKEPTKTKNATKEDNANG